MPIVTPDTSQMVDMGPIEPGTYKAKVKACGVSKGKEKGTAMIVPDFEVFVPGQDEPRPRTAWLVIEGKGTWGFDQFLRALHMDELADKYKDPSVSPKPPLDTDIFVGQELQVVIEEQLYKGQKRDSISGYIRL
jgi:hypothetical protein